MSTKPKTASVATEAARLSTELGWAVTSENVRWWKKKGYPLDDTGELRKHLSNQRFVSGKPTSTPTDTETVEEFGFSYSVITDELIAAAEGMIPVSEVLDYLRDQWEADEIGLARFAMKTEAELAEIVRRGIALKFCYLHQSLPSLAAELPACPDWLSNMLFIQEPE